MPTVDKALSWHLRGCCAQRPCKGHGYCMVSWVPTTIRAHASPHSSTGPMSAPPPAPPTSALPAGAGPRPWPPPPAPAPPAPPQRWQPAAPAAACHAPAAHWPPHQGTAAAAGGLKGCCCLWRCWLTAGRPWLWKQAAGRCLPLLLHLAQLLGPAVACHCRCCCHAAGRCRTQVMHQEMRPSAAAGQTPCCHPPAAPPLPRWQPPQLLGLCRGAPAGRPRLPGNRRLPPRSVCLCSRRPAAGSSGPTHPAGTRRRLQTVVGRGATDVITLLLPGPAAMLLLVHMLCA
jgi:hypothetical protein